MTDVLDARAHRVAVANNTLTVDLVDGRTVTVPIAWYPRLVHGTPKQQQNWRLIGQREGIHWPDLDEDIALKFF